MKIRQITSDEVLLYSTKLEDDFYDRKAFGIQPKKVERHAVAFANADGGEIIIGIADDKTEPTPELRWHGATDIEEFNPYIQSLVQLNPSLDFRYTFLQCVGKTGYVMLVSIQKGNRVYQTSDNTVYVRHGASSLPYKDAQKIQELAFAKGSTSYEDDLVKIIRTERVIESKAIKSFLMESFPSTDPLDYVVNENLVDFDTLEPRVAGILLFSDNPPANLPRKCGVKIARYETREDDPERDHLKETFTLGGPLYSLIYETVKKVSDLMSSIKIWTVDGLKNVSYPPESIHEIITNALIHRDYSISDDVHIHIFNDRIEVLSPGKLPGYVTVENILDARYSRNSKIVRTLNRYENAPNKDLGEGLNTAFQKMKDWRLKNPVISEERNGVLVVIPHTSLASPEEAVLEFLEKNKMIQNKQARELTGIRSENSMKNVFYRLRDEGLIERVPGREGPNAAWKLRK
ncbi:RNA-binding domain-containing protein [Brevibacillus centrosporus]|uniref:RNA-binding domain-containing protein n=1 Tax=Brevibacillus centrosporus TaxID=54910 RepID=UPI002E1DA892|nr:ATP-binding protein [Brevibacillus centrosporus]